MPLSCAAAYSASMTACDRPGRSCFGVGITHWLIVFAAPVSGDCCGAGDCAGAPSCAGEPLMAFVGDCVGVGDCAGVGPISFTLRTDLLAFMALTSFTDVVGDCCGIG